MLKYPREERFVMVEQFRRTAISISLNIAEGYGTTDFRFKRYLKIAKGSLYCPLLTIKVF
jgi:four helix bundle protein